MQPVDAISDHEREKIVHNITVYGMVMDIFLSAAKLIIGAIYHSPGLVADGVHSLSDMLTDIFVLVINRFAHDAPDEEHPYGHARFETVGTVLLGAILLLVALGMGYEYAQQLISKHSPVQPSAWALVIVVLSLFGKEWQYRFTLAAARKVNSPMLEANAWHSRSDAFSSLVVLVGVSATLLGYPLVETVAALLVAVLIGKMGFSLSWNALHQLTDKGLTAEQHAICIEALQNTPGVVNVHMLRGRLMSHQIFIDVHIQVSASISVSEGHQIGELAMVNVRNALRDVKDITLHIDYEADDAMCFIEYAPLRNEIEQALKAYPTLNSFEKLQIHYRKQRVDLELSFTEAPDTAKLTDEIKTMQKAYSWLRHIKCLQVQTLVG